MYDPKTQLELGVRILEPALVPHGFTFTFQNAGSSSGGNFAAGTFTRHDRCLDLHHRWGLGIIDFQIGTAVVDLESYLKYLGVDKQSKTIWTTLEAGLERYEALRHDLENYCSDFICGPGTELEAAAAARNARLTKENRELMAYYYGDDTKRQNARELFFQKRYAESLSMFQSVKFPDLLAESERQMIRIAESRIEGV